MTKNWMQHAVKRPGAFTKKAKSAGMSVPKFTNAVISAYKKGGSNKPSLRTYRQAVLARTFAKYRKK
jgi:hypothetical protein